MYTGTRLTTAIHRRLLSRFFLREGWRLYTGYDFWTIFIVHGRFDNSSHFVHVIDTHYIWAACGETGSYISLRLSVQASQLPSFLFIIFIYNLLSDKTITQIKSIICWVNKHLLLLCYYLRILFPFLPYSIIFGVSCDFKSQLAFEWQMLPVTLKDIELKKITERRLIVWKSRIHSTFYSKLVMRWLNDMSIRFRFLKPIFVFLGA